MKCYKTDCEKDGTFKTVLELRSKKNGPVTKLRFRTVLFCEDHSKSIGILDVLSDEGFVKISKFMRENGKPAPVQRCITLSFESVTEESKNA